MLLRSEYVEKNYCKRRKGFIGIWRNGFNRRYSLSLLLLKKRYSYAVIQHFVIAVRGMKHKVDIISFLFHIHLPTKKTSSELMEPPWRGASLSPNENRKNSEDAHTNLYQHVVYHFFLLPPWKYFLPETESYFGVKNFLLWVSYVSFPSTLRLIHNVWYFITTPHLFAKTSEREKKAIRIWIKNSHT